jgi:hypothetical protein
MNEKIAHHPPLFKRNVIRHHWRVAVPAFTPRQNMRAVLQSASFALRQSIDSIPPSHFSLNAGPLRPYVPTHLLLSSFIPHQTMKLQKNAIQKLV